MRHAIGRRGKRSGWRVLTVLVAVFISEWAKAQSPVPEGQRIIHQSWTFKEGAPESVEALAQTADGYLWLGTPSGLFRFDGIRFELFRSPFGDQLPSTNVSALFAPATGRTLGRLSFRRLQLSKERQSHKLHESACPDGNCSRFRSGPAWNRMGCYIRLAFGDSMALHGSRIRPGGIRN